MKKATILLAIVSALMLSACATKPKTNDNLVDAVRHNSVSIFPALIWSGAASYDHETARTLAPFIRERTTGEVVAVAHEIPAVNSQFAVDRPRYQIVADAVRRDLEHSPLKTQLGIFPVYVYPFGTKEATEIHVLLFDAKGEIVRRIQIDQPKPAARTPADCTNLVMATVRQREAIYAPKPASN